MDWLDTRNPDFEAQFQALLGKKREVSEEVDGIVRDIIARVRAHGDAALYELTERFDRFDARTSGLAISSSEIDAAFQNVDPETLAALELARDRIFSHHEKQKPQDHRYIDSIGAELGSKWTAIEAIGLYVPGGTASYPSSVLMNALPAIVAGVPRIVMVVPTPDGVVNPLVLVAARLAGVTELYRIGGAQAIAALAYGTETIKPVAKIMGPGNAFVAAAKRRVFGTVGIDMIAGPSEVLVIADENNNPDWLASDLLAQAEHDTAAQSILITPSKSLAEGVVAAVERQLRTLPRGEIARKSWADNGAVILVQDLREAIPLTDRIAPEHLELAVEDPEPLAAAIRNAGAMFLGRYTPEVIGDYVGGSNHVLPTARSAKFSSVLNVLDYMKRTSILKCTPETLRALGPAAIALAKAEGLEGHGRSVGIRLNL